MSESMCGPCGHYYLDFLAHIAGTYRCVCGKRTLYVVLDEYAGAVVQVQPEILPRRATRTMPTGGHHARHHPRPVTDDFDEMVDALEATVRDSVVLGDLEVTPVHAGVRCDRCGLGVEVAWAERRTLPEAMRAHMRLCPLGPGAGEILPAGQD